MKIIFLDVDGVIKPNGSKGRQCIEPHAMDYKAWPVEYVRNLQDICDNIGEYGVVISSTWRKLSDEHNTIDWWTNQFINMGFDINVIGITEQADNGFRGREVLNWLMQGHTINDVRQYVAIDDSSDFYEYQNLYQVDGYEGIQRPDVNAIIAFFNEGKSFRKPPLGYHKETRRYDNNDFSLYDGYLRVSLY